MAARDLNNYVLDGIDNNSNDNGASTQQVNLGAIAEFKIHTSSYDADLAPVGAALNVVIKSGTNQIHGSVFENYRMPIRRTELFAVTRHTEKFNQPGATVGFPIIKNKLFFLQLAVYRPAYADGGATYGSRGWRGHFLLVAENSRVNTIHDLIISVPWPW